MDQPENLSDATGDDAARPPRVMMLIHNLDAGGAQTVVCELAFHMKAAGWDPVVCAWRRGGVLEGKLREVAVRVEVPERERSGLRRAAVIGPLRRMVARHAIDVVHAHMSDSAAFALALRVASRTPYAVTHHAQGLIDTVGRNRPAKQASRRRLVSLAARRADVNVVVSEAIRDELLARTRVPPARVVVIPNGVALPPADAVLHARDARRARAAMRHRADGGPTILAVGRLNSTKGFDSVLWAAPSVRERFPNARFIFVGEGPDGDALRRQAEQQGIGAYVRFVGATLDVAQWYASADVLVSASHQEGHPLVVLEAMSWGLPVVLSDIRPHRELAGPGRGRLAPVDRPLALADAVIDALDDWPETESRAVRAASFVSLEHSIGQAVRRHLDLYRRICSRPSSFFS